MRAFHCGDRAPSMSGKAKRLQLFFVAYIGVTIVTCVVLTIDRWAAPPRIENDPQIRELYAQLRVASDEMDDAKIAPLIEKISARKAELGSGVISRYLGQHLFTIPFFFGKSLEFSGWKLLGSIGAVLFAGRWVVQFVSARRAGKPVTPIMFWIMSLIGSNLTLMYFIYSPKQDMVGVLGNFFPTFVAAYNMYLEIKHRSRELAAPAALAANTPDEKKKKERDDMLPRSAQSPVAPLTGNATETAAGE